MKPKNCIFDKYTNEKRQILSPKLYFYFRNTQIEEKKIFTNCKEIKIIGFMLKKSFEFLHD